MDMGWRFLRPKFRPCGPVFLWNFSGWTEPIHWLLDRNFRKFWSNGPRPQRTRGVLMNLYKTTFPKRCYHKGFLSLRASSRIWASEASLARTRERGAQIGELARMLRLYQDTNTACLRRLGEGYTFHVPCLELCVRCCKNFWPLGQWLDKHKRAFSLVEQCRVTSWPCP